MRRHDLMILSLLMALAGPASAGTFERAAIAPDLGVDVLNRSVTRDRVQRDVFSDPYSTATIAHVDLYDVFPYVESRTFQVVSDPAWNRLVFGETGQSLAAYDGATGTLGALLSPHGIAVDEFDRVYVADTGHDRVVVLQASTVFDAMTLTPLYEVRGLSHPFDVAVSDGGTPFVPDDDMLLVADTGRNRVAAFALAADHARPLATLGELGSGTNHFAGPLAIAVGRSGGASTGDVYVADAHTRRIVRLRLDAGGLHWLSDRTQAADVLTSLDTDQWGNLYAAAPNRGVVEKFNAALVPVAELGGDLARPRSFDIPYAVVRDHRAGSVARVGQPHGLSVEQWSDVSGARRWNLGVAVGAVQVGTGAGRAASFALTDRADVSLEITDMTSGRILSRRALGALDAGPQSVPLLDADLAGAAATDNLLLRVSAASSYPDGATASSVASFSAAGGPAVGAPGSAMLLEGGPSPFKHSTRIAFVLPAGPADHVSLAIHDAMGRRIRTFDRAFTPGFNEVVWDGTDDRGLGVPAGMYVYRLKNGDAEWSRKLVRIR